MRLDGDLLRDFLFKTQQFKNLNAEERKKATPPIQKRLRLEDTTIEAAQDVLTGSPDGVLLHQDELSGWFGSMDKYSGHRGAAKDRGFWLQSYNGGRPHGIASVAALATSPICRSVCWAASSRT